MYYYDVAVNFPKTQSVLTYKSPLLFQKGDLVHIPLGRRIEKGCIIEEKELSETKGDQAFEIKEISSLLESLRVDPALLSLLTWMSRYYHYSLGKLIFDILPLPHKPPKRNRTLDLEKGKGLPLPFALNPAQKEITNEILKKMRSGYSPHLIHGVTGSGKTAIYLNLMKKALIEGNSVLFLLPEINLTTQFLDFFQSHLDVPLFAYHGSLTPSRKFSLWSLLEKDDNPKLVLGARSALFLPVKNPSLIIVDEEHDLSFKQDDRCPYHARNVAMKKAQSLNIPIVLGSATPSTDTLMLFKKNQQNYYRMTTRIEGSSLPQIKLVDLREKPSEKRPSPYWPLSQAAIDEMATA